MDYRHNVHFEVQFHGRKKKSFTAAGCAVCTPVVGLFYHKLSLQVENN